MDSLSPASNTGSDLNYDNISSRTILCSVPDECVMQIVHHLDTMQDVQNFMQTCTSARNCILRKSATAVLAALEQKLDPETLEKACNTLRHANSKNTHLRISSTAHAYQIEDDSDDDDDEDENADADDGKQYRIVLLKPGDLQANQLYAETVWRKNCWTDLSRVELMGLRLPGITPTAMVRSCPQLRELVIRQCLIAPRDAPVRHTTQQHTYQFTPTIDEYDCILDLLPYLDESFWLPLGCDLDQSTVTTTASQPHSQQQQPTSQQGASYVNHPGSSPSKHAEDSSSHVATRLAVLRLDQVRTEWGHIHRKLCKLLSLIKDGYFHDAWRQREANAYVRLQSLVLQSLGAQAEQPHLTPPPQQANACVDGQAGMQHEKFGCTSGMNANAQGADDVASTALQSLTGMQASGVMACNGLQNKVEAGTAGSSSSQQPSQPTPNVLHTALRELQSTYSLIDSMAQQQRETCFHRIRISDSERLQHLSHYVVTEAYKNTALADGAILTALGSADVPDTVSGIVDAMDKIAEIFIERRKPIGVFGEVLMKHPHVVLQYVQNQRSKAVVSHGDAVCPVAAFLASVEGAKAVLDVLGLQSLHTASHAVAPAVEVPIDNSQLLTSCQKPPQWTDAMLLQFGTAFMQRHMPWVAHGRIRPGCQPNNGDVLTGEVATDKAVHMMTQDYMANTDSGTVPDNNKQDTQHAQHEAVHHSAPPPSLRETAAKADWPFSAAASLFTRNWTDPRNDVYVQLLKFIPAGAEVHARLSAAQEMRDVCEALQDSAAKFLKSELHESTCFERNQSRDGCKGIFKHKKVEPLCRLVPMKEMHESFTTMDVMELLNDSYGVEIVVGVQQVKQQEVRLAAWKGRVDSVHQLHALTTSLHQTMRLIPVCERRVRQAASAGTRQRQEIQADLQALPALATYQLVCTGLEDFMPDVDTVSNQQLVEQSPASFSNTVPWHAHSSSSSSSNPSNQAVSAGSIQCAYIASSLRQHSYEHLTTFMMLQWVISDTDFNKLLKLPCLRHVTMCPDLKRDHSDRPCRWESLHVAGTAYPGLFIQLGRLPLTSLTQPVKLFRHAYVFDWPDRHNLATIMHDIQKAHTNVQTCNGYEWVDWSESVWGNPVSTIELSQHAELRLPKMYQEQQHSLHVKCDGWSWAQYTEDELKQASDFAREMMTWLQGRPVRKVKVRGEKLSVAVLLCILNNVMSHEVFEVGLESSIRGSPLSLLRELPPNVTCLSFELEDFRFDWSLPALIAISRGAVRPITVHIFDVEFPSMASEQWRDALESQLVTVKHTGKD